MLYAQQETARLTLARPVLSLGGNDRQDHHLQQAIAQALFDRTVKRTGQLTIIGERPEIRVRKAGTLLLPLLGISALDRLAATGSEPDLGALQAALPARRAKHTDVFVTKQGGALRTTPLRPFHRYLSLQASSNYSRTEAGQLRGKLRDQLPELEVGTATPGITFMELHGVHPTPALEADLTGILNNALPHGRPLVVGPVAIHALAGPSHLEQFVRIPLPLR